MPASTVVSLRVSAQQTQRLRRRARQLGRTPSETGAMLLEEGLRRADFAFIDFRDSAVGRQAYVLGTRLAVWQVVSVARAVQGDVTGTATHLGWPTVKAQAALSYAKAFPEEIEVALEDAAAIESATLARTLPQLEEFIAPSGSATSS
ncbi:MAG: transcriptional regulator [Myxococcota bacterium]